MSNENYLNHPNFGLLFRVCLVDEKRELFTTLYAQRLFFLVANGQDGLEFEPITRTDARILVESRMRSLRRLGQSLDYDRLHGVYKQTFQ
ncbi:transcriptional coactivator PipX [Leptothermofonsia sp. ETS-13]|uniref:transcriptional coactivator PipX n=1 Tax=Leptothermofonsia sp. ETS-13 TaxID=3035696 RepID=UPI003BA1CB40